MEIGFVLKLLILFEVFFFMLGLGKGKILVFGSFLVGFVFGDLVLVEGGNCYHLLVSVLRSTKLLPTSLSLSDKTN